MACMTNVFENRTMISEVTSTEAGKEVTIAGWWYDSRELGKLRFAVVRDITGEIQVTGFNGETDASVFETMGKVNRESVVLVTGVVKKAPKAPGGPLSSSLPRSPSHLCPSSSSPPLSCCPRLP